jgi:2-polyprenyl-6-methoxyphenol hydroxylase-like FAD-dependent oxidoreductase
VNHPFVSEGIPLPGGHFGVLDSRLDFHRLPSPFPYTLALPQERTEALLEAQASELGADILRGHQVTGFTEHPDHIAVHTTGPHSSATLRADYLVGCDGARSTVRTAAGIDCPGTPSTVLGWFGDVVLDHPPAPGYSYFGPAGTLMAVPMPGGIHRLVGITPRDLTTTWPDDLALDELRQKVHALTGTDFGMRDPLWLSRFGNATRLADHYRKGRVFLAGDAAHQHFPAGGVGMNVGIQDAANLAWKLAATLTGWAPESLLDTYHAERHPVGADLITTSRAQVALMTAFTPEGLEQRTLLAELITALPDLNDHLAAQVSSLAVAYPPTTTDAHARCPAPAPPTSLSAAPACSRYCASTATSCWTHRRRAPRRVRAPRTARPHRHPPPATGRARRRPRPPRPPRRPHRLGKRRTRRHRPHRQPRRRPRHHAPAMSRAATIQRIDPAAAPWVLSSLRATDEFAAPAVRRPRVTSPRVLPHGVRGPAGVGAAYGTRHRPCGGGSSVRYLSGRHPGDAMSIRLPRRDGKVIDRAATVDRLGVHRAGLRAHPPAVAGRGRRRRGRLG